MPPQEQPQPFHNRPRTFAYIPRRDGDPPAAQQYAQLQQPRPVASPQGYYYQQPFYPMQQAYAMHQPQVYHQPVGQAPIPTYYYPPAQYYPWYPGYGPQAAAHAAQSCQLAEPAKPQPARFPDGRLPWYGRTPAEVNEDAVKVARAHDKPENHDFAPTADASAQFWCRMPDTGEYKMIPLGTIINTWKGDWKHDPVHHRVYFVATELK